MRDDLRELFKHVTLVCPPPPTLMEATLANLSLNQTSMVPLLVAVNMKSPLTEIRRMSNPVGKDHVTALLVTFINSSSKDSRAALFTPVSGRTERIKRMMSRNESKPGDQAEEDEWQGTKSDQPVQGTAVAHFQSQPPSYWLLEDNMNSIQITSQKGREYLIF
ncbi:hypothetical protein NC652_005249 [Populus alba x Populus x berolinensis]|nr:hypothetical protein NC652_005249 [Populus alba x Populus x berolinensis]